MPQKMKVLSTSFLKIILFPRSSNYPSSINTAPERLHKPLSPPSRQWVEEFPRSEFTSQSKGNKEIAKKSTQHQNTSELLLLPGAELFLLSWEILSFHILGTFHYGSVSRYRDGATVGLSMACHRMSKKQKNLSG